MKSISLLTFVLITFLLISCQPQSSSAPSSIDPGVDPETWTTIPSGEFFRGQHDHETTVDYNFEMMVTNVTNGQFARFLNESIGDKTIQMDGIIPNMHYPGDIFHGYKHEEEIPEDWYPMIALDDPHVRINRDGEIYLPDSHFSNHPVTFVTWFGAKAFCEFYGWRLPTEIEWEKAARGTDDNRPFPWGKTLSPENANYYSSHDIFEKTFGKAGSTTPVGFYNGNTYEDFTTVDSPSPYGLYDMAGNVWQWTGDVYEDQHYRYMRGGSKDTYGYNLRVWTRNSAGPEYYSPAVGFRCARDQ
jgi:formylglycine-generating enzyme required for sulfatase activity